MGRMMKANFLHLITVIFTSLLAAMAHGQIQAGGGGQALDANQQAGSGGYNRSALQLDFRARNDVITGNVSGGRAFQDTVGYGAPGSFGLSQVPLVGGDDTFNFRRDTVASNPNVLAGTLVGSGSTTGNYAGVFDNFTTVPAARTGGQVINPDLLVGAREVQVLLPPSGTGVRVTSDTSVFLSDFTQVREDDGLIETRTEGTALQVSPLLGLRRVPVQQQPLASLPFASVLPDDMKEKMDKPKKEFSGQLDPDAYRLSSGIGQSDFYADQPAQVSPAQIISQQLRLQVDPQLADESLDERIARLEASLYTPLKDTTAEPGDDVYLDLLREMRNRGQDPDAIQDEPAAEDAPETDEMKGFRRELEMPSEEQIEEAESERMKALRKAYGLPDLEADREADGDPEQEDQSALDPKHRKQLEALVRQLDYEMAPLETLAGERQSRVNDLLQKADAEVQLAVIDAMTSAPREPFIRAGLVNAQLGAGMIRSAAHSLRILYEKHPELIATRYGENLLPKASRLKWVQGELQNMINNPTSTADPGLMMAYLGYQVDSRQLIRYGLAVAEGRSPKDPLLPLLRRIWLDEKHDVVREPINEIK